MGQRRRHRGEGQQTHQHDARQGEVQRQDWRRGGGADRGGAAEALEGRYQLQAGRRPHAVQRQPARGGPQEEVRGGRAHDEEILGGGRFDQRLGAEHFQ